MRRGVVILFAIFLLAPFAAQAAQQSAWERGEQMTASVFSKFNTSLEEWRAPLIAKKAELEEQIIAVAKREATIAHSDYVDKLNAAVESTGTVRSARSTSTPKDTAVRVALQLYRGLVIFGLYLLDHKWLLYLIVVFIVYEVVRHIFRFFFYRRVD